MSLAPGATGAARREHCIRNAFVVDRSCAAHRTSAAVRATCDRQSKPRQRPRKQQASGARRASPAPEVRLGMAFVTRLALAACMTVGASAFGMPGGGASSGMIHLSGGGGEPTPAPRKWLTQAVHHINTTARPSRCGEATIRGRTNTSLQMAFRSLARRSPLGSGTCASVGFGVQTAAPNAAPRGVFGRWYRRAASPTSFGGDIEAITVHCKCLCNPGPHNFPNQITCTKTCFEASNTSKTVTGGIEESSRRRRRRALGTRQRVARKLPARGGCAAEEKSTSTLSFALLTVCLQRLPTGASAASCGLHRSAPIGGLG